MSSVCATWSSCSILHVNKQLILSSALAEKAGAFYRQEEAKMELRAPRKTVRLE